MPAGSDDGRADAEDETIDDGGEDSKAIPSIDEGGATESGSRSTTTAEQTASASDPTESAETDGREWRFSLDELGDGDDAERSGNVAGTLATREPLEPGDIDLENAFFFLVGAIGTILFVVLALTGL